MIRRTRGEERDGVRERHQEKAEEKERKLSWDLKSEARKVWMLIIEEIQFASMRCPRSKEEIA